MSKRFFDPLVEKDAEILRELAEDDSNVLSDAEDSEGEEDAVENQLESSDTEQEISSEDDEEVEEPVVKMILGKDKITRWKLQMPVQNVRTRLHNIVSHLPGVKGAARNARSVLACWSAFFDDDILNLIVSNTNKYIFSKKDSYSRERDYKITNLSEIKAFIGLLYMAEFHRNSRLNTADLWAIDNSGIELLRITMSRNRFHFPMQNVRFDEKETRNERKICDKLAPIRDLFKMFVEKCQQNYSVGEYVTVDEMLLPFRGKCSFRQYIPSKPSNYGIKILALVDSKMFYTTNLGIYVRVQPVGPYKVDNSAISVVKRLCAPLSGSGRNITGDNSLASIL
ncbi:piggyBac transposable element-derived protein 4-like [Anthonomus grandis grandis]|uniref:piggyBac transposable element-derived protein 4-like n=1 Tax=Anthonomus grandis grandis TaxID=2921223 RepID=UPI002164F2F1|nr:piggyBac transposable element-derived protein 4-like [Anthonomus grandis grandis]